jgi:predicted RecA/RadA family phage recombinase
MAKTFVQPGDVVTLTAPTGGVTAGTTYRIGNLLVVALVTVAQTLPFDGMVGGVHDLTKASGQAWTEGQNVYWDDTAKNWTTTATSNYYGGVAAQAQASGDVIGRIRLNGIGVKATG